MSCKPQFWPKPITFDRSHFAVVRMFDALGAESHIDPDMTREGIILDIASGQIDRVVAVFEFNPIEGWSHDITSDIAEAVEAARLAAE